RSRRQWVVNCVCNGSVYALVINDLTGNLCCLYYEGELHGSRRPISTPTHLTDEAEAIQLAIQHLKAMKIVAPEEEIALSAAPRKINMEKDWKISWKVRHSPGAPTFPIVMVLARDRSLPQEIRNQREIDCLSDH